MSGKSKSDPSKTQKQEIVALKQECVEVYAALGVKKAAAAAVRRSMTRLLEWEHEDEEFRLDMLGAEYRFLSKNKHKVKLDNVFAHLFDEYKPPKQEIDVTLPTSITINHVHPLDRLPADPQAGPGLPVPD